ncbi:MAG: choice-of-anchor D domain-containing protein [Myxococcales bacterium]|nr:choice-of-anchor D domain-containing protein [Myxococcales bacterium]
MKRSPGRALRSRIYGVWLAAAALAIGACDCGDDPQLGRLTPRMEVSADPLDFGEVPLGATKRLSVSVGNAGNLDLHILSLDTQAPFAVEADRDVVPPGDKVVLDVLFRPTNDEPQIGTLALATDDPDQPMVSIALSGRGVQGVLTVSPTLVELEDTKVGSSRSVELVLRNLGLEPAGGDVVPDGFAQPEHFALTLLPSFAETAPFVVPARGEQVLDLTYRPLTAGRHDGRIVFEICGSRCGLEVEVRASAADSLVRLAPPLLDFGDVGIGETRTQQLRVENAGDNPVTVELVSVSGSAELGASVGRALPVTVAPGDALGINVEYTPASAAELMGEVQVRTGPVQETLRASVIGRGQGPRFRVDPDHIFFGVERQAGRYRRALLMVNEGSSDVVVTQVTVSGAPEFSLEPGPGLPARLGPGESLVMQVAFQPSTLGEYSGTAVVESDDASLPRVEVPLSGGLAESYCELTVSPERISFGLIPPNFERTQQVTVTNAGREPCNVVSGAFRAPIAAAITERTAPWPATLAPGQSVALAFRFAPVDAVESKANYVLRTDDPVFPERTISIFGTAAGNLDVFTIPNVVDFGSVGLGCTPSVRSVQVVNAGTFDVTIDRFALTSSTTELRASMPLSPPVSLPAGATRVFQVMYEARDYAPDRGFVEIGMSDYGLLLNVPLLGAAAEFPRVTDRFEQARNNMVDVLFVIDDSCSMADDQAALASNFSSFIRQADVRQVDFQIGITTTTVFPLPGALVGPVMSRSTSALESVFQRQAAVGIGGSGIEQGLEAMASAFQLAESGQGFNQGLLRAGAGRVVVIVSDEDDQSPAPVAAYLAELRRRAPDGFTTAMVSGQASGCINQSNGGVATPAWRYEEFAGLTGGLSESICSSWAQTLANIGQAAFGLKVSFSTTQRADPTETIEVWVNGQPVSSGWHFDPGSSAVVFDQPPAEGAVIEVEYTPQC